MPGLGQRWPGRPLEDAGLHYAVLHVKGIAADILA